MPRFLLQSGAAGNRRAAHSNKLQSICIWSFGQPTWRLYKSCIKSFSVITAAPRTSRMHKLSFAGQNYNRAATGTILTKLAVFVPLTA